MKFNSETIETLKNIWEEFAKSIDSKFLFKEVVSGYSGSIAYRFEIHNEEMYNLSIEKSYVIQTRINPLVKPLFFTIETSSSNFQDVFVRKSDFFDSLFFFRKSRILNQEITMRFFIKSRDYKLINKLFSNEKVSKYFLKYLPEFVVEKTHVGNKIQIRLSNKIEIKLLQDSFDILKLIREDILTNE